ncbi:hypothetical protein HK100_001219 [Physocladia obscura]|uniref:GH18 domain-containing protein n=1 Tax=Physocladia obscura TaxID=109957 RepID=A0AAD5T389_9FUNG|nr:hypothetical protein HK100_001219 [Physocladia obscura]
MDEFNPSKRLIVYHTSWACYGRNFQVKDLEIDAITDINYAFWDLRPNAVGFFVPTCSDPWADTDKRYIGADSVHPPDSHQDMNPYHGNFGQQGKRFRFGLSIGGWTFSKYFSSAVATPSARTAFVNEILIILEKYPGLFDRIDLDWEHISPPGQNHGNSGNETRPNDGQNFSEFLQLLQTSLPTNIEITACLVADPSKMSALPLAAMAQHLTTLNVMTYDFSSSSWGPCLAGHQANLRSHSTYAPLSVERAVDHLIAKGVPAHKIVIGCAYYSRAFANTDGLGKPSSGTSPDKSWEEGVVDYKALPLPGSIEYWDPVAQATYSYDPQKRVLSSYDSVDSVRAKCAFVHERGLAGVIVWESSADFPVSHERSLTAALARGLGISHDNKHISSYSQQNSLQRQQQQQQPESQRSLPPGFIAQWSDHYKAYFYVNTITGVSQWELPISQQQPAIPSLSTQQPELPPRPTTSSNVPETQKASWL